MTLRTTAIPAGALLLMLTLPSCGSDGRCGSGASCGVTTSPAATSSAGAATTAQAHGWTTTTTIESAAGLVRVEVTVPGPLQVDGGCVPDLAAWLVGPDHQRIDPTPSPGLRCQAIALEDVAAGQSRTFSTHLHLPAPGTYEVHGLLRVHLPIGAGARVSENIPVVTLRVPDHQYRRRPQAPLSGPRPSG